MRYFYDQMDALGVFDLWRHISELPFGQSGKISFSWLIEKKGEKVEKKDPELGKRVERLAAKQKDAKEDIIESRENTHPQPFDVHRDPYLGGAPFRFDRRNASGERR